MLFKTDWKKYLHKIRKSEVDIILSYFGNKRFDFGLEIGAGDGYQTSFLSELCSKFISSDLNFNRIKNENKISGVEYIKCDADYMEGMFKTEQFDFVYSSNVLEHLSKRESFLNENVRILANDGYTIHIVPNRWMKFFYILLFYPHLFTLIIDRVLGMFRGKKIFQGENIHLENNINSNLEKNVSKFRRIFIPQPHGNYTSHVEEWKKWGKAEWRKKFINAGFFIEKETKGPVFSGYGFGFNFFRLLFERIGFSSEYIFILKKKHGK